jgi:transposase
MDTTSLSFEGEGGVSLGEHGYSKDFRPDLRQMILGVVMDGRSSTACTGALALAGSASLPTAA